MAQTSSTSSTCFELVFANHSQKLSNSCASKGPDPVPRGRHASGRDKGRRAAADGAQGVSQS